VASSPFSQRNANANVNATVKMRLLSQILNSIHFQKNNIMIKRITLATMALGVAAGVHAQSATFAISARITPAPCTITVGNGGLNDWGNLTREALVSRGTIYTLPTNKLMMLSVNCPSPTKLSLSVTDNRAATALAAHPLDPTLRADMLFGLGTQNGSRIGAATLNIDRLQIKTSSAGAGIPLLKTFVTNGVATSPSTWAPATSSDERYFATSKSITFADTVNATTPAALTDIFGPVLVQAFLDKSLVDSATSDIVLDGSGTITLTIL
jgi:type 1 fimbria pilin